MRHLELPASQSHRDFDNCDVKSECSIEIKDEDLETLDIKEDFMDIPLDVALEGVVEIPTTLNRSDFSDDDELSSEDTSVVSPSSNASSSTSHEKSARIKNRRKNLQPQRAIQSESSNSAYIDVETFDQEIEDYDDSIDIEADIFNGLKEETGEEFNEEMRKSVKEEWKAHWGVKCHMCEKVFTHRSQFEKHYRSSYSARPQYTCSYCDKTMEKYSTFRSHCYRHITEGRYRCYKCNKGFSLESMLHDHILAKHTEVKPFICEECGKGFVTKPGLKIHLKKHRNNHKEDYPCVECGKVLHTRGGLTAHMNVHRLGRRFMCDVCGKTFTQKVNMQQHVKHHNGERPYSCDKCGKCFAEKSHLARHYSFHSEKRPFKCDVCQKMYKTERCLKVHSMVHASSRPYVCSYCSKGFLSSTKLKQHLNIHTGQRPFKCKYCEKTFTNYPNWLKHTRRRHKVDHKTGLDLVPKQEVITTPTPALEAKLEPAPTPTHTPADLNNFIIDYAMGTGRTDEHLTASLAAFADERLIIPQHNIDFTSINNAHPVGLVVPCYSQEHLHQEHDHEPDDYLQNTNLVDLQQQLMPQTFPVTPELLHTQLMQQQMLQM